MKVTLNTKKRIIFTYIFIPLFIMLIIGGIISAYQAYEIERAILLVICLILILILIYFSLKFGSLTQYIQINKQGVFYFTHKIKYKLNWNEISLIGMSKHGRGQSKVIIFSRIYNLDVLKNYGRMSNDLIIVFNRKGVIDEIKKYWKDGIVNGE